MFKRADEIWEDSIQNIHGGRGLTRIKRLWDPRELSGGIQTVQDATLTIGASAGLHPHTNNEEVYYILAGQGRATIDGRTWDVGPGDTMIVRAGSSHAIENTGNTDLRLIVIAGAVK